MDCEEFGQMRMWGEGREELLRTNGSVLNLKRLPQSVA